MTGIDLIIDKLRNFSVPELAGMSVGAGTVVLILFCVTGLGAWCCGIRRCPASHGESWVHSPPPTPPIVRVEEAGTAAEQLITQSHQQNPLVGGAQEQGSQLHPALQRFQEQVVSLARLHRDN